MELRQINSLVELFFKKYEYKTSYNSEKLKKAFLVSLKEKNKGNESYYCSWGETNIKINILSKY